MRYSIINATIQQVQSVGGQDIKHAPNTYVIFATLTNVQAIRLRAMGCIVNETRSVKMSVLPPIPVTARPTYTPAQLSSIAGIEQLKAITSPPLYGSGFNVAIIGTGIRETHQLVNGRVVFSKNYTTSPMYDGFNHDTGVCSIIVAVAPQCNILNLKVMDDLGNGTEEEVILAIDDCITMVNTVNPLAPHIINMSLGNPDAGDPNDVIRLACRAAIDKGILVVAAAGNSGPNPETITSPSCECNVLCIGSVKYLPSTKTFQISDWSSRGPTKEGLTKPDGVFFGEDIIMASSDGDNITVAKSGTSFSAPFCSGIAILYQEAICRVAKTKQISIEDLINTWLPIVCIKPIDSIQGKDNNYGNGLLLAQLIVQNLGIIPSMDIASILSPLVSVMFTIPFFGMINKVMVKK